MEGAVATISGKSDTSVNFRACSRRLSALQKIVGFQSFCACRLREIIVTAFIENRTCEAHLCCGKAGQPVGNDARCDHQQQVSCITHLQSEPGV